MFLPICLGIFLVGIVMSPQVFSTHGDDHPTNGTIDISPVSITIGDTVSITVNDPDLDKDPTVVETFSVITSPSDPAYGSIGIAGMPVEEDSNGNDQPTGRIIEIWINDPVVFVPDASVKPECNLPSGEREYYFDEGFTMTETGPDTGIFTGSFNMPRYFCDESTARLTIGQDIEAVYHDLIDGSGVYTIHYDTSTTDDDILPGIDYFTMENLVLSDSFGSFEPVNGDITVGQEIWIGVDVTNIGFSPSMPHSFKYIAQVRDANGVVVSYPKDSGVAGTGTSMFRYVYWEPDYSGSYTVTAFLWAPGGYDPTFPFTDPITTTVNVVGDANESPIIPTASISDEPGSVVQNGPITIGVDKASYYRSEIITISGTIDNYDGVSDVSLVIERPASASNPRVAVNQVSPDASGAFSIDEIVGPTFYYPGTYVVKAYNLGNSAETMFEVSSLFPPEPAVYAYLNNVQPYQFASFDEMPVRVDRIELSGGEGFSEPVAAEPEISGWFPRYFAALHWNEHLKPLILGLDNPLLMLEHLAYELEPRCDAAWDINDETTSVHSDGSFTEEHIFTDANARIHCNIGQFPDQVSNLIDQGYSLEAAVADVDEDQQDHIDDYLQRIQMWQELQQHNDLVLEVKAYYDSNKPQTFDSNDEKQQFFDTICLPSWVDECMYAYPEYIEALFHKEHIKPSFLVTLSSDEQLPMLEAIQYVLRHKCNVTQQTASEFLTYNPDGTLNQDKIFVGYNANILCGLDRYVNSIASSMSQGKSFQTAQSEVDERVEEEIAQWLTDLLVYGEEEASITEEEEQLGPAPPAAVTISLEPGSGVPGCHATNTCYSPTIVSIDPADDVVWINNSNVAHTVTSGNATNGPTGVFDSSLIMPDLWYHIPSFEIGTYEYFCLLHPWAQAAIIVGGVDIPEQEEASPVLNVSAAKNQYDLDEMISLNVSLDNIESNATVTVDVLDSAGNPVVTRSVSVSPDSTQSIQFRISDNFLTGNYKAMASAIIDGNKISTVTYFKIKSLYNQFQITSIQVTDQQGNPSTLSKGTLGYVKVTITSDMNITALITVNLFDADLTTLGVGSVRSTISAGESEIILSFMIPSNAASGNAEIFANGFTDWISNGGVPLTGEFSITEAVE